VPQGTVTDPTDQVQNKNTIDFLYKAHNPDYVMLLGSQDVIPHQDLTNPLFGSADSAFDPDANVASDLPYACENPYSVAISDFDQITRVVGRLPDVTGGTDPAYLAGVLGTAAKAVTRPINQYTSYLGVSTQNWVNSTQLSLQRIFRSDSSVQISPLGGPDWTDQQFASLVHFFNCHGNPNDPDFYGQLGSSEPVSHRAALLAGKLADGTVGAMECCYGAQLFDPGGGQAPMANAYLSSGAYGYLGSTTVSYGDQFATSCADTLTSLFLTDVLNGASLGRALLQARQAFIQSNGPSLEAHMAKTLAQFILLGDPSLQPVVAGESLAPASAQSPPAQGINLVTKSGDVLARERVHRRRELFRRGLLIKTQHSFATERRGNSPSRFLHNALHSLAEERSLVETQIISYKAPRKRGADRTIPQRLRRLAPLPNGVHAIFGRRRGESEGHAGVRLLIVRTLGNRIISFTELHRK
jgi:hypothetical protein